MTHLMIATLAPGHVLSFNRFRGVVLEQSKATESSSYSETRVSANAYGASSSTVSATTNERSHTIWLRSEEGIEREIVLQTHAFGTRAGHEVSVSQGSLKEQTDGFYLAAVNHSTGGTWKNTLGRVGVATPLFSSLVKIEYMAIFVRVLLWSLPLAFIVGLLTVWNTGAVKDGIQMGILTMFGPCEIAAYILLRGSIYARLYANAGRVDQFIDRLSAALAEDKGRLSNTAISDRVAGRVA